MIATERAAKRPRAQRLRTLGYKQAAILMTGTVFLVPLGGLVTAPIVARALGADGRGEMAAAGAPATLLIGVATLGLPEAATYFTARQPSLTRRAIALAVVVSTLLGLVGLAAVWAALPFLSAGDSNLARLMLIATALGVPTMAVNVLRGAATGRQLWRTIAAERVLMATLRVGLLFGLWLNDSLDLLAAVVISAAVPVAVGVLYLGLLLPPPPGSDLSESRQVFRPLVGYGSQMWLGSLAVNMLARLAPLLMVPLSSSRDLGLYIVAVTVSDVPWIVTNAVQGTLFGVVSRDNDVGRVTRTSRLTLLAGLLGCAGLAAVVPFTIGPLFGGEFVDATVPTLLLLVSAVITIPGTMAASGLSAWGRPTVRSIGFILALVVNLAVFLLLVPVYGVIGACITNIVSNCLLTIYMLVACRNTLHVRVRDLLLPQRSDLQWMALQFRRRRPETRA